LGASPNHQDRSRLYERPIAGERVDEGAPAGCRGGLRARRPDHAELPERGGASRSAPGDCQTARLRRTVMTHCNRFVIHNDSPRSLTLNIEPEGAFFPLGRGEEVSITDTFRELPVTVKLTTSDKGDPIISLWPGDGEVRVEKGGVDVFDLIQKGAGV